VPPVRGRHDDLVVERDAVDRTERTGKGSTMFYGLTDTDWVVHNLRMQEQRAKSEFLHALNHDAPAPERRVSLVARLAITLSRPVQTLVPRRGSRPRLLVAHRS